MITTNRKHLVGGHMTEEEKRALAAEAQKNSMSVSRYLRQLVRQRLAESGHQLGPVEQERAWSR